MNLDSEVLQRVASLVGVAYLLSIPVAHAVEVIRKFSKRIDGIWVLLVALVVSVAISFLLLRPQDLNGVWDSLTVAFFTALGSVGGDTWIRKVLTALKKTPETWRQELPTKPER